MNKITVIIPTYNRPDCIRKLVSDCLNVYDGNLFSFEIHDSSTDDSTARIIEAFISERKQFPIKLYKYSSQLGGDQKTRKAVLEVKTSYFFLMGDGNLVNFNCLEKLLIASEFEMFNIIDIEGMNRIGRLNQDKNPSLETMVEYKDYQTFFEKYFSHLTYWGGSICNTQFVHTAFECEDFKKIIQDHVSWWLPCSYLFATDYIVSIGKSVLFGTIFTEYISPNPCKTQSGWTKGDNYFDITFKTMNKDISLVPHRFEKSKVKFISSFRSDYLVSKELLDQLRANKTINKKSVERYKLDISKYRDDYPLLYKYAQKNVFFLRVKMLMKIIKSRLVH